MPETDSNILSQCQRCDGDGSVTHLSGIEEGEDGERTYTAKEYPCFHCGGDGLVYDGLGCPRCGAGTDAISSMTLPSGSTRQSCSECGWSGTP